MTGSLCTAARMRSGFPFIGREKDRHLRWSVRLVVVRLVVQVQMEVVHEVTSA